MTGNVKIKLYDTLRKELNLSEEKSRAIANAIEEVIQEDIKAIGTSYKSEFREDFHFLDKRITETESRLNKSISDSKNDMYKAMFLSGLVQLIAILSGVLAIVKMTFK
jgi:transcription elongation GreA/GreB family factor